MKYDRGESQREAREMMSLLPSAANGPVPYGRNAMTDQNRYEALADALEAVASWYEGDVPKRHAECQREAAAILREMAKAESWRIAVSAIVSRPIDNTFVRAQRLLEAGTEVYLHPAHPAAAPAVAVDAPKPLRDDAFNAWVEECSAMHPVLLERQDVRNHLYNSWINGYNTCVDERAAPPPAPIAEKTEREHATDGSPCWCEPDVEYVDPITGAKVIAHRGTQ